MINILPRSCLLGVSLVWAALATATMSVGAELGAQPPAAVEVFPDNNGSPPINAPMPPSSPDQASGQRTPSASGQTSEGGLVKDATRRGLLIPFAKLVKLLRVTVPGRIVQVRLFNRANQVWVYEIAVLDDEGRYTYAVVNGKTGAIIRKRRK